MKIFTFADISPVVRVYTDPGSIDFAGRPVISMGIFDGVHRGHQELIRLVNRIADSKKVPSLLITFWPHPRVVLHRAGSDFRLLSTLDEKIRLLEKSGAMQLLIIPFTMDFAQLSPVEFIDNYLMRHIRPGIIVAGEDIRFGAAGAGNKDLLAAAGEVSGFSVKLMEPLMEEGIRISSSSIRSLLLSGNLEGANKLLGYPFLITGRVGMGKQIGRSIGFPTANLECCEDLKQIPCDGVYAVSVESKGKHHHGMLNIGVRPTIGQQENKTIEVHLFNRDEDLYGESLAISFIARLRDEMKFGSLEELQDQLKADRQAALKVLNRG